MDITGKDLLDALDGVKAQLNAKVTEVDNSIELSKKELGEEFRAELTGKTADLITDIKDIRTTIAALEAKANKPKFGTESKGESFEEMVSKSMDNDVMMQLHRKNKVALDIDVKATTFTGDRALAGGEITNQNPENDRMIRSLFRVTPTDIGNYPYVQETSKTGAPGMQTEGSAKEQIGMGITVENELIQTLAAFDQIPLQLLDDVKGLTSYLGWRMPQRLMNIENDQILAGTGTGTDLNGIVNGAGTVANGVVAKVGATGAKWQAIISVIKGVASVNGTCNFVRLNSADYYDLIGEAGSDGHPINFVSYQNATLRIAGVEIQWNNSVPSGTIVAGDNSVTELKQRDGVSLRFFEQDSDNVQKNMMTVRIEERLALVKYAPKLNVYETFANIIAD